MTKIAFIGGGRMAEALIARLGSPQNIIVSDISQQRLRDLKRQYRVRIAKDNVEAFSWGEIVILAVKPQDVPAVIAKIVLFSGVKKLVVSIAAGIPLSYLQKKLPGMAVVRAMPNNPCLVGMGVTALAKGKKVNRPQLAAAIEIFYTVGEVREVPEKWLDAITGLSGSGPAFVYQTIEALAAGGVAAGLPKNVAAELALQTVLGAAITVKGTGKPPNELREMVTSPGGTTIEGLKVLGKRKFSRALVEAVVAAARKSRVLAKQWTS